MPKPIDYPRLAEEAFNRRDFAALAALWAEDFHYVAPDEETRGRAAAVERERRLVEAFPDLRADLSRHFAGGDRLLIEGVMSGTHGGALRLGTGEIPATGRTITIEFAAAFTFADGLVGSERVWFDRLGLLAQLGLAEAVR